MSIVEIKKKKFALVEKQSKKACLSTCF